MTSITLSLLGLLGLTLGSFLSVLIPRLHEQKPGILGGRSECPYCHHKLSPGELIPVVSYFLSWGRCRSCKERIGWFYPALEVTTAILFIAVALSGLTPLPLFLFYTVIIVFIFFYDLLYMEIADEILLPSLVIAFLGSLHPATLSSWEALWGAGMIVAFFLLQIVVSRGQWLGGGDLRIGAFMGLILGWKLGLIALFFSYLAGSVITITLLLAGKLTRKSQVPFGPFLMIGTLIALFFGNQLIELYLNFIGI